MAQTQDAGTADRDVALTIPARAEHLVLARLALSAVCRLTSLGPEDVADLKLAITEAASDFVYEGEPADEEERLNVSFLVEDGRLAVKLEGPAAGETSTGDQELGRAIIGATVDEAHYEPGLTELVKYLPAAADG